MAQPRVVVRAVPVGMPIGVVQVGQVVSAPPTVMQTQQGMHASAVPTGVVQVAATVVTQSIAQHPQQVASTHSTAPTVGVVVRNGRDARRTLEAHSQDVGTQANGNASQPTRTRRNTYTPGNKPPPISR